MARTVRKRKSKKIIVRMLERVVNIIFGHPGSSGMLGPEPDKSEHESRNILRKLKELSEKDPNHRFGIYFTRLQLKLLKRMGVASR